MCMLTATLSGNKSMSLWNKVTLSVEKLSQAAVRRAFNQRLRLPKMRMCASRPLSVAIDNPQPHPLI